MEKINDLISLRLRSVELAFKYFSCSAPFEVAEKIESYVKKDIELENVKDDTNKFIELAASMYDKNSNNTIDLSKLPKFALDVKIKKLSENTIIPCYAHATDAGLDLVATSYEYKSDIDCHVYGTGLAVEIPEGYVGLLYPRSSNRKTDAYMCNHVGVIDSKNMLKYA